MKKKIVVFMSLIFVLCGIFLLNNSQANAATPKAPKITSAKSKFVRMTSSGLCKIYSLKLKWKKVKGATQYRVYYSNSKSGCKVYMGYTSGCTYTEEVAFSSSYESQTIYYYVASYNGKEGKKSKAKKCLFK